MTVVGRRRKRVLGREPVIGNQRRRAQATAQPRNQRGVRVGKAEGERSAVQIEDHPLARLSGAMIHSPGTPPSSAGWRSIGGETLNWRASSFS